MKRTSATESSLKLPDYSQWLTPDRLELEEQAWAGPDRTWPHFVAAIDRLRAHTPIKSMIEFGCGTGWVPAALPETVAYTGMDANPGCVERARARNPNRTFVVDDLRSLTYVGAGFDLTCAFSVMKHFGLHEWPAVLKRVLSYGMLGLLSIPTGFETKDDGTEFPHVTLSESYLQEAVIAAGHDLVITAPLPWGEVMVYTCRR